MIACSHTKPDSPSHGPGLTYRDLILKDYDEMSALVRKHTSAAHKIVRNSEDNSNWENDAKVELVKAERLILSRPDTDNMASKLILEVRREISAFGHYDDILRDLTRESIDAFDPNASLPTEVQTTFLFMLENLMAEMKSNVTENTNSQTMLKQIRDAKIHVPPEVIADRKLQGMFLTDNPSEEASRILKAAGLEKK